MAKKVFAMILIVSLIFIVISDNIDLQNKVRYQKAEIKALNAELDSSQDYSNSLEFIIDNSIVMRDNYNKKVNYMFGEATAYHPPSGGINSDHDPTRTSIGLKAEVGIIAVNPRMIPYGSQVMIISGNTVVRGIAGDTGGAMRQNPRQVDILVGSRKEAMEWGRRKVHIIWWEE